MENNSQAVKSETRELLCSPYTVIIENIVNDKTRDTITSHCSKFDLHFLEGQTTTAVVNFGKESSGFEKAVEYEQIFSDCSKGRREWAKNRDALGSSIYGWMASENDYQAEGLLGVYLRKNTKIEVKNEPQKTFIKHEKDVPIPSIKKEEDGLNSIKKEVDGLNSSLDIFFSWREPHKQYSDWKERETPLPEPINQGKQGTCIPLAVKVMMDAQMTLIAKGTNRKVPKVSLDQLKDVFFQKSKKHQTLEEMLKWLSKVGVVAEENYIPKRGKRKTGRVRPRALRYKVKYDDGFDPSSNMFYKDVCKCLVGGVLIGEFMVKSDYSWNGKGTYKGKGNALTCDDKDLGHAVLLIGFGKAKEGNETYSIFEYMNSYGKQFGRDKGFGDIVDSALHFVYNTRVIKWFE